MGEKMVGLDLPFIGTWGPSQVWIGHGGMSHESVMLYNNATLGTQPLIMAWSWQNVAKWATTIWNLHKKRQRTTGTTVLVNADSKLKKARSS